MEKLTEFDMAEYLDTEELREGYLELVAKEGTQEELLKAISDVARAREMSKTVCKKVWRFPKYTLHIYIFAFFV